uniref:NADH-ubiquinone oxidoreductase chain 1 n=1 Tax=Synapturanus sp. MNHN-RA-2020.0079 TaxID=2877830 RepID=A0A8K1H864_9NEOB|nr:NADH dehydrogenase subunit 1 [Synapturanus sp. MNHN-RA-2020.0079]
MNQTQSLITSLLVILPILLAVALFTLLERKIIAYIQHRKGPNVVGPKGLLQPFADGLKLFMKEPIRPSTSSPLLFLIMPTMALILAMAMWMPVPMPIPFSDINLGIIFMLTISSLMVYTTLGSGWASNSKYSLIGALRAIAQTISYEVSLALIILTAIFFVGAFTISNFISTQLTMWLLIPIWPMTMMWYASTMAETNRAPFDLSEGESELVSGFNVEYASGPFAMFMLTEYTNILTMNTLSTIMFLSPSNSNTPTKTLSIMLKSSALAWAFSWIRASYPRFRYDQLMHLLWKNFLPLTLAFMLWQIATMPSMAIMPPIT